MPSPEELAPQNIERVGSLKDRLTRKMRWEQLGDDLIYAENELDRAVIAPDQIRTVIRTFRDRFSTDIFPGRIVVPRTLIFAKDDSHADDIVKIVREVRQRKRLLPENRLRRRRRETGRPHPAPMEHIAIGARDVPQLHRANLPGFSGSNREGIR
jgi:hypothetical protein